MEQMEDLQRRIQGALDRIGSGFGVLEEQRIAALTAAQEARAAAEEAANQSPVVDEAALAALREELEDEQTANAQLNARNDQLHSRLVEMETKVAAIDKVDQVVAMEAELELLRNEAAKAAAPSPEIEALRSEVARLKAEHEGALNQAAAEKDLLQDQIDTLTAEGSELEDTSALRNEINYLKVELEQVRAAPSAEAPEAGLTVGLDARLLELDGELQALRASNDQLRAANEALRSANAEGVGDPSLINQAMEAEIEGLRAARAADKAEVNAVIERLAPLLPNAPNLPEGEQV